MTQSDPGNDSGAQSKGSIGFDPFWGDSRFAVRSLLKARGFTLTVVLTLVLGISVTTLVYNLTDWIIFRQSQFPKPQELFYIGSKDKTGDTVYWQPGFQLKACKEQIDAFAEFAAMESTTSNVVLDGQPLPEAVDNVLEGTFKTLGMQPRLGRGFLPEEYQAGKNDVVLISDLLWRKTFNASPDVLGRKIMINRKACVIVGVWGKDQQFPADFGVSIYRPMVFRIVPDDIWSPGLSLIGRLKPGVTRDQALAALSTLKLPPLPQWATAFFKDQSFILTNITERNRPDVWWVLMAAAAFLYGISCLNVTNLMLIRLLDRRRELSIRFAIGGSRWQVTRTIVIEGILLSLSSCVAVAIVVRFGFPPIFNVLNGDDGGVFQNPLTLRTIGCFAGLSLFACLAATLAPASRILRADINPGLKEGGPSMGESRTAGRIRNLFVVLQAAFAVILLTGTGLMVRSFEKLSAVDLGFDPVGKVKVWVFPATGYTVKPEARLQLFDRLQKKLSFLPGVKGASYAQDSLLVGHFAGTAQLKMSDGTFRATAGNFVSGDFQKTAGLTMKEGKWISGKAGDLSVVINETMAKERFPGLDPVGQFIQIQVSGDGKYPVIGVVKDVRDNMRAESGMRFYIGAWAYPPNVDTLVLRLDKDPGKEFAGLVRKAIFDVDPDLVVGDARSMSQVVTDTMSTEHYAYNVLRGMAAIALVLTAVGIFSVIAFTVDSRMTEFGVRVALGATPTDLNGLVMRRGVSAAAIGVVLGIGGAMALTRFMESMLYQTSAFDPTVYVAVGALLLVAAVAACWLPARRAARVDVMRLLKPN